MRIEDGFEARSEYFQNIVQEEEIKEEVREMSGECRRPAIITNREIDEFVKEWIKNGKKFS